MKLLALFLLLFFLTPSLASARVLGSTESLQAYGDLHRHDDNRNVSIDLVTLDVYVPFVELNSTHRRNVDFIGDNILRPNVSGVWKLDASISFQATKGSGEYGFTILINGIAQDNECHAHRTVANINDVGNVGMTCVLTINDGENVSFAVRDEMLPIRDIEYVAAMLNIELIELTSTIERRTTKMIVPIYLFLASVGLIFMLLRFVYIGENAPVLTKFLLSIMSFVFLATTVMLSFEITVLEGPIEYTMAYYYIGALWSIPMIIMFLDAFIVALATMEIRKQNRL